MIASLFQPAAQRRLKTVRAVLFDLDGTLLQVSMSRFIPAYIDGLARHFSDLVSPERFTAAAFRAVRRLFGHDDQVRTNEERFLASVSAETGIPPEVYRRRLERFYDDGLARLEVLVTPIPLGAELVMTCLAQRLPVALATNPVFPRPLVEARLRWGGLDALSFRHLTCYENSCYCKPDPRYFLAVANCLGVPPQHCLMVGNDTGLDLAAAEAGMLTFLLDTYLEDRPESRRQPDFRGDHARLLQLLQGLVPPRGN